MQSWNDRVGQCIFCAFRAVRRPSPQANGVRSPYSTSPLSDDLGVRLHKIPTGGSRDSRLSRTEDVPQRFSIRSAGGSDPSSRIPDRATKSGIRRELNLFNTAYKVKRTLQKISHQLSQKWAKKEFENTTRLDPDLVHWKSFKKKLETLYNGTQSQANDPEDVKLRAKLEDNLQVDGVQGLDRAVHFSYIDHILASRTSQDGDKLRQYMDLRYPTEWYATARQLQREIHLHVGPTNSGKTYNALKRLEEAGNGYYAGPLRLLAHEVWSRFRAKGTPCDLITGDDVRIDESTGTKLSSSTVEMVDTVKLVDVAVIDEIQMMSNLDRGWAWTRAFLGANAKEVHVCGELRVVPLIREMAASMGDTLHVHQYERLNELKAMSRSLRGNLKLLRKGDCLVCFSVLGIHAMKKQIEKDTGRRVAIVYGSLPPETRAKQAALFNEPDNDYDFLVASDAIGMGLNLSIKRIIFETIWKWNGVSQVRLSVPQLKQIAGRAGRYKTAQEAMKKDSSDTEKARTPSSQENTDRRAASSVGLVTCLDEKDLAYIQKALGTEPEPLKTAAIQPPANFLDEYASHLPKGLPFEYVIERLNEVAKVNPRYFLSTTRDQREIARTLEAVKGLDIIQRYTFTSAPANIRSQVHKDIVQAFGRCIAETKHVTVADVPEIPLEILEAPASPDRGYLGELERLHNALTLFLWLSYRFSVVFRDREMAMHARSLCEAQINTTLVKFSPNPRLKQRLAQMENVAAKTDHIPEVTIEHSNPKVLPKDETTEQPLTEHEQLAEQSALPIDWAERAEQVQDVPSANEEAHRPIGAAA